MTNPTPPGQVPDALPAIQRFEVVDCIDSKHVPAVIPKPRGPWVRYEDHAAALCRLHAENEALRATHVQNPAEIEHVAGDVSKNSTEKNVTVYAELPQSVGEHRYGGGLYTDAQMRAFADATHALRAQPAALAAGQAPAGAAESQVQSYADDLDRRAQYDADNLADACGGYGGERI